MGRSNESEGEILRQRLRDLLLRFPCAVLEGVRWSVLCKVYKDRYKDGFQALYSSPDVARSWLSDLADFEADSSGDGDGRLHLREMAALSLGQDGQLACWPLLVQRLGEIVRSNGSRQHANALEVPHEDASHDETLHESEGEVVGVLLAQLKPLLRRHWDPAFEERAVGFFSEAGHYVGVKKMKHLVAELLKWRVQRRSLTSVRCTWSAVDTALDCRMVLAVSQRHNDMVLCCPALVLGAVQQEISWAVRRVPDTVPEEAPVLQATPSPGCLNGGGLTLALGPQQPPIEHLADLRDRSPTSPSSTMQGLDAAQRIVSLEKESWRLRIENAELKKRLKFDSQFMNKEIRRLRIENVELKKRCFFPSHLVRDGSGTPGTPVMYQMQPVWLPAPLITPPITQGGTPTSRGTPSPMPGQMMPGVQMSGSGQASPGQGAVTPNSLVYAMMPGQALPPGQPWLGQMMPGVQMCAAFPCGPATCGDGHMGGMSPFSSTSQQARFLPHNLFSSDPNSTSRQSLSSATAQGPGSGNGSPSRRVGHSQAESRLHTDDRWVSIPSGIVEQTRAHLEQTRAHFESGYDVADSSDGADMADAAGSPEDEAEGGVTEVVTDDDMA